MEKYILCKQKEKKVGVATIISNKTDFKTKTVTKDKVEPYPVIKGSIQQEVITLVSTEGPNIEAPKHIKQILTEIKRKGAMLQ